MEKNRCSWCLGDDLYQHYHDTEWGVPLFDDQRLFEFLILETFQAGLSWITVLRKREAFRNAFDHFNVEKVASYDSIKMDTLMGNAAIIRNNLKIKAAVKNAQAYISVQEQYGSFSSYIWNFVNGRPVVNHHQFVKEFPPYTPLAVTISKDLKKRVFHS